MESYLYDAETAAPAYNLSPSAELRSLVAGRVAAGEEAGAVIQEMIMQLGALRAAFHVDIVEAARAAQEPDEALERTAEGNYPFNERNEAATQRNRERFQRAKAEQLKQAPRFLMEADTTHVDIRSTAGQVAWAALSLARHCDVVHESARIELDQLAEELMSAPHYQSFTDNEAIEHVVWRMPRDVYALIQSRAGTYTQPWRDRTQLGEVHDALRSELAAWREAADDRSYVDIYKDVMAPSGSLDARSYVDALHDLYPEVAMDLLRLIEHRVHQQGDTHVPLSQMLDELCDLMNVSWPRMTD